jgi:hypothetical protein
VRSFPSGRPDLNRRRPVLRLIQDHGGRWSEVAGRGFVLSVEPVDQLVTHALCEKLRFSGVSALSEHRAGDNYEPCSAKLLACFGRVPTSPERLEPRLEANVQPALPARNTGVSLADLPDANRARQRPARHQTPNAPPWSGCSAASLERSRRVRVAPRLRGRPVEGADDFVPSRLPAKSGGNKERRRSRVESPPSLALRGY